MYLSKRIAVIRKTKALTQEEMADRIGITQAAYSLYEKESGNLSFNTINKIANALGCSIIFLIDIQSNIYDEVEWKRQKIREWENI